MNKKLGRIIVFIVIVLFALSPIILGLVLQFNYKTPGQKEIIKKQKQLQQQEKKYIKEFQPKLWR